MPVKVVDTEGNLPPFWDRSAVFVANLLGLFFGNEEETQMLANEVGEIDSYGGRLIPILNLIYRGGENVLVLETDPDPDLCGYFREGLGLSLPDQRVLLHSDYQSLTTALKNGASDEELKWSLFSELKSNSHKWLDGYVTDDTLADLACRAQMRTISSAAGSRRGNNKRMLHEHLEAVGMPTVEACLIDSAADLNAALDSLEKSGFRSAVIKSAIGASGIGLLKVESLADRGDIVQQLPDYYFYEGACIVQGWLRPGENGVLHMRSPSVQLFLDDETVYLYDSTEQILSHDSVHEGNESPPPYFGGEPELRAELFRQAAEAGSWLHDQGYRGTGSVDFLVVNYKNRGAVVYVCEINARVTGATYPSLLARNFWPEGAWLMRNLRFGRPVSGQQLLEMLREHGSLFDPERKSPGILPVNFNRGADCLIHKGQFLCIGGNIHQSHGLLDIAKIDLPVAAETDRD
ncbi:MAG: hypothetical protein ACI8UO_003660 [Verrucomicrobiales bacterium]|jgi:hypothetical protein